MTNEKPYLTLYPVMRIPAALIIITLIIAAIAHGADVGFDYFYMEPTGEWILEHGSVPRENISSVIPLKFMAQNWLLCLLAALGLRASVALGLGWHGLIVVTACLLIMLLTVVVAVAWQLTGGSRAAMALSVLAILLVPNITLFRPIPIVLACTTACLWANRRYVDTGHRRLLLLPPLITVLHTNIQAATVLAEPLVCLGYGLAQLVFPQGRERRLAMGPFVTSALCLLATLVNPYGIEAPLYALVNAKVGGQSDYVVEMRPITWHLQGNPLLLAFCLTFLACFLVAVAAQMTSRAARIPETVMALVGLLATLSASRNLSYAILLVWWLLIVSWGDVRALILRIGHASSLFDLFALGTDWVRSALSSATCIILFVGALGAWLVASTNVTHPLLHQDSILPPAVTKAANYIEERQLNPGGTQRPCVLSDSNMGSYSEFCRFACNCSSRVEAWEPAITGAEEHYFFDTAEACRGDLDTLDRLLALTEWDYIMAYTPFMSEATIAHIESSGDFEPVFTEGDVSIDTYVGSLTLYQRKGGATPG